MKPKPEKVECLEGEGRGCLATSFYKPEIFSPRPGRWKNQGCSLEIWAEKATSKGKDG